MSLEGGIKVSQEVATGPAFFEDVITHIKTYFELVQISTYSRLTPVNYELEQNLPPHLRFAFQSTADCPKWYATAPQGVTCVPFWLAYGWGFSLLTLLASFTNSPLIFHAIAVFGITSVILDIC